MFFPNLDIVRIALQRSGDQIFYAATLQLSRRQGRRHHLAGIRERYLVAGWSPPTIAASGRLIS